MPENPQGRKETRAVWSEKRKGDGSERQRRLLRKGVRLSIESREKERAGKRMEIQARRANAAREPMEEKIGDQRGGINSLLRYAFRRSCAREEAIYEQSLDAGGTDRGGGARDSGGNEERIAKQGSGESGGGGPGLWTGEERGVSVILAPRWRREVGDVARPHALPALTSGALSWWWGGAHLQIGRAHV